MQHKLIALIMAALLSIPWTLAAAASEIALGTSGGIFTVPVQVNRAVTMQFLVDPGAGVVVIPLPVLRSLIASGTVTQDDIVGVGTAELADSSTYVTARVNLRELRVGNVVVRDVTAAVAPGLSQPLLGQSFFRRFAAVTFDNRRNTLVLSDDAPAPVAQAPAAAWVAPYPAYPAVPSAGSGYAAYPYAQGWGAAAR